jgi:hypothetical protein
MRQEGHLCLQPLLCAYGADAASERVGWCEMLCRTASLDISSKTALRGGRAQTALCAAFPSS